MEGISMFRGPSNRMDILAKTQIFFYVPPLGRSIKVQVLGKGHKRSQFNMCIKSVL